MEAIGLIEVIGLITGIEVADACAKAANIKIISLTKVGSGIMTLTISGDVGAVKAAVEAGVEAGTRIGTVRSSHIIPRISKEAAVILGGKSKEAKAKVEIEEAPEEAVEETIDTVEDSEDEALPKYSIKELKSMVKSIRPEMTYKDLNNLKKSDLVDLIKDFNGEDK